MTAAPIQTFSPSELQATKARRKFNLGETPDTYRPGDAEERCAQLLANDWAYVFGTYGLVHEPRPTAFELLVLQQYHDNDADSSVHHYYELRRRMRVIEDEMEQARSQIKARTPGRPSLTMKYALLEFRDAVARQVEKAGRSLERALAERGCENE